MRITVVSYGRTFNTGNFQSERYDLTAELDGEDEKEVQLHLKKLIEEMHFRPKPKVVPVDNDDIPF